MINREAMQLAPLIGFNEQYDMKKYGWFMKIILQAELPEGWIREKDPGGQNIYYNTLEDDISFEHPMNKFYRKTFNRILKAEFDKTQEKVVKGLVLDEISKVSIETLK